MNGDFNIMLNKIEELAYQLRTETIAKEAVERKLLIAEQTIAEMMGVIGKVCQCGESGECGHE